MRVLVTGAAGFIGMHVSDRLLRQRREVIGIDNMNDYYDPSLKHLRLEAISSNRNFRFFNVDVSDLDSMKKLFAETNPEMVVHLAAQAGVRYSITHPMKYVQSNLVGFSVVLECCRNFEIKHLVYASSSSVYGTNVKQPYSVSDRVDHPISLYAATKKSNELMAHAYSHMYQLPTTGLRYFTVYGPWGRPDMSPWLFTSSICANRPIDVYNFGNMKRDFTFVDDVTTATIKVLDRPLATESIGVELNLESGNSRAPYRIYNVGSNRPIELMEFIRSLEESLGRKAILNYLPLQLGDVISTHADVNDLENEFSFSPTTSLSDGISAWTSWYTKYSGI